MHDSAYRIGELVMRTYSDLPNAKILEVGSLNVNGCLRDAASPTTHFVGLDLEEGPSVDFVIAPGGDLPVEEASFDLVMASSVFEHDVRFWDTFVRMCRAARPGGHVYVNAPSNGTVHRYPMDCWRFYPDAGLALAEHARSEGIEIDLVESFIGDRHSDVWNDFVAVFRKGPSAEPLNTAFVYLRYPSLNARTWQSRTIYNESEQTEDMTLIADLRRQCETLSNQETAAELEQAQAALAAEHTQRAALTQEVDRLSKAVADSELHSSRTRTDNEALAGEVASLESNLRQRQEEIEQAWARSAELTAERDELSEHIDRLETEKGRLATRLVEADGWVFDLAGERRKLQTRLTAVEADLSRTRQMATKVKAAAEAQQRQLQEYRTVLGAIRDGVARLKRLELSPARLRAETERLHAEWSEGAHPLADLAVQLHAIAGLLVHQHEGEEREKSSLGAMTSLIEQKAALHKDVEMLMGSIEDRERAAAGAQERIASLTQTVASLRSEALNYHAKAASALEQLELLRAENKQQARTVRSLEDRVAQKDRQLSWLRRLYQVLGRTDAGWNGVLPPQIRRQKLSQTLKRNGHFDGDAYLAKYQDVAEAGMDPLRHYVLHGMAEGRFVDSQA
ncbi:putative nucleic acid-binding Zn-ribbon protein [Novosphingobium chloroacetimidivorans]|uniref:Putative nucleic acid-binding Zn-ribbon protein n=1 Tax=Novosphingobium chloroacetimidivorans TaxID=1428314 RepID=A0A7W7NXQ5_9SPHN|nr:class I SAM-dependent methyltransferase [Novosphingobium chloroacetimidivorans]MBB4860586.1 putative nucleic acid-binding Zn-ribbon protein [Novosphingobium chloroacetimidivorans]